MTAERMADLIANAIEPIVKYATPSPGFDRDYDQVHLKLLKLLDAAQRGSFRDTAAPIAK